MAFYDRPLNLTTGFEVLLSLSLSLTHTHTLSLQVALKRGGTRDDESRKVPRLEQESDTTLESLD